MVRVVRVRVVRVVRVISVIEALELIHGGCRGGIRHWLDRGDGIDSWQRATLAGAGRWD